MVVFGRLAQANHQRSRAGTTQTLCPSQALARYVPHSAPVDRPPPAEAFEGRGDVTGSFYVETMESIAEHVTERYIYRSDVPSSRHRRQASWYLVARLEGTNVVARIDSLGLLPTSRRVTDAVGVIGPWRATPSRHHVRARLALSNA